MKKSEMQEKMIRLVKELVAIASINGSPNGEAVIAEYIFQYFASLSYFKENPEHLFLNELKNDKLKRKNVFAWVSPRTHEKTDKMIVIHGHIDTVGVEDYGNLKDLAFSCDELFLAFMRIKDELPEDMKNDLESGDWIFGRGVGDMKSGVAMFMVLIEYFSEHQDELPLHILFMANPVEENLHTGIIESIPVLQAFKHKGYDLVCAINSDYITRKYPQDAARYLYTGSIGKLLPCFFFWGDGNCIGEPASLLVGEIDLNPKYSCGTGVELTPAPSLLKISCAKDQGFVYFNYMVTDKSMPRIISELKQAASWAMNESIGGAVYTFNDIYIEAKKKNGPSFDQEIEVFVKLQENETSEQREMCLRLTQFVYSKSGIPGPACVLFFAPPFCPHNTLDKKNVREKELYRILQDVIHSVTDEHFEILDYFPFLSDSSYLKIQDDEDSLSLLKRNFPIMSKIYPIPIGEIKELNLPALTFGVYACDAHHWAERLYVPYSFGTLPQIIMKYIEKAANIIKQ